MNKFDKHKFFTVNVHLYDKDKDFDVYYPSSLNNPRSHSVMFVMEKYLHLSDALKSVENCLVFWPEKVPVSNILRERHVVVLSKEPRKDYNRFFRENNITYYPQQEEFEMVNGAVICKTAKVGTDCIIMPGAYIGGEVYLGDRVYIGCGTKLVGRITIGDDVIIRENAVIGADGLTTERDDDGSALTMPQFGGVIIGNKVQIGANTVIGRGAIDNTVIASGCKIDNCCFISHNVVLDENVFIVGETILMGSSKAKKGAYISGNATIRNKITIGENAFIGMGAVVTKDVDADTTVIGNPAKEREK